MLAVWFFAAHGWLLYYGDAEAHLNIARRLVDSATLGWDQLGSPWLPVPHLITAPFAAIDALWFNGLAGSIPAAACFITAAMFLFLAVQEIFESYWPAWTALLVFVLNPNALYLQSTAMTEPVFAAELCGLLYFTVRFRGTQRNTDVVGAALCALAGTWTRYEAWFLLPFCAIYLLTVARRGRSRAMLSAILFTVIAAPGPLLWLFYNWWLTGNWLEFANGPGSAAAIQHFAPYPGFHHWHASTLIFRICARAVLGPTLYWITALGLLIALFRRAWWPVLLLCLPPIFYVWSVHSSYVPIFLPEFMPGSWYNTRYGLSALPLAAFCAAAITRTRFGFVVVAVAVLPWLIHPTQEYWITWKESEQNSISRRAWTSQAAAYLETRVRPGEHIATEFNDTMGIARYARIDMKQIFHPGNTLLWQAAAQRPDLFLNTTWIVCQRASWSLLSTAAQHAPQYRLAHTITVPGAPPLDIYHHAYPLYQSARREK